MVQKNFYIFYIVKFNEDEMALVVVKFFWGKLLLFQEISFLKVYTQSTVINPDDVF